MSVTKRISNGDYAITTAKTEGNPNGNVSITTHTLYIDGNLTITGNASTQFDQNNPTITLNANLTLANAPYAGSSGIVINRGSETFTNFYWNEVGGNAGSWTLSDANGVTGYIATSYKVLIQEITPTPSYVSGFINVSGYTASVGKSGLYVNTNNVVDELATATSAKKYAIIFG